MDKEIFVQNIKNRCAALGLKPTAACREAGVGQSFISDINRGQIPSVAKVQALASYLRTTTSSLLGESDTISENLMPDELDLLNRYRRADQRTKELVDLALQPFGPKSQIDQVG